MQARVRKSNRNLAYSIRIALIGLLFGFVYLSRSWAQQNTIIRDFRFSDGGTAVEYFVPFQSFAESSTLVVFLTGSGCASARKKFSDFVAPLSTGLSADLIMIQKRGIAVNSSGYFCNREFRESDYLERIVDDQVEFIRRTVSSRQVKTEHLIVVGFSEGALIASLVARHLDQLQGLVLVGGGGWTMRKTLQALSATEIFLSDVSMRLPDIEADPKSIDLSVWGHTYRYWSSFLDANLAESLIALDVPIFVAAGEDDQSVPIEATRYLIDRLQNEDKKNMEVCVYQGADHTLKNKSGGKNFAPIFFSHVVRRLQRISSNCDD